MKIILVSMPWQALESPSLPVGILHSVLTRQRPHDRVQEYHGSLHWAEYLYKHSAGRITPSDYTFIAENGLYHGLGDWIFAGVLWGNPNWGTEVLQQYLHSEQADAGMAFAMRDHADDFVDVAADDILAGDPDVVGFTTTFMQNVPSLALAMELKRRSRDVSVVFGGSNCDGAMGHALHRNFDFIDYVVRGEGEDAFPALLECIERGLEPAGIPGLCYRHSGTSVANSEARNVVPPGRIPIPDYRTWQNALESSVVCEFVEPKLVVEGARGCWWGEKHHCTFCGLNGSTMLFRSKSPTQIQQEISTLVEHHQILDLIMVDNIVDMRYLTTVMPWLAASGWDLRVHYEVKSNLRREQVLALAQAHVTHVQPGIESLSTRVLRLMDKGVTGAQNVRIIRDCEDLGLTCSWNYLYGFPDESAQDFMLVIEQFPALTHLQPPIGASRIALERFSPNFENPSIGFTWRRPSRIYDHIYDLPGDQLNDLVYLFDTEDLGITGATVDALEQGIATWRDRYADSRLLMIEDGDHIVVQDLRQGWSERSHELRGWQASGYRRLARTASAAALLRHLRSDGYSVSAADVTTWLNELRRHGLIFDDGDALVSLATSGAPTRLSAISDPLSHRFVAQQG